MKNQKEILKNELNSVRLFERKVTNFLQRYNYHYFDIEKTRQEKHVDFIYMQICHIVYDRECTNTSLDLFDFQQLLASIASKSQCFSYVLDSSSEGIKIFLGVPKEDGGYLKDSFEGLFSGSEVVLCEDINLSKGYSDTKAMLGIPSFKKDSDKKFSQSLEKIAFPMRGKEYRIVLVAESYSQEVIQEIIRHYQEMSNIIHRSSKININSQVSVSKTQGETDTVSQSDTIGTSETIGTSDTDSTGHSVGFGLAISGGISAGLSLGVGPFMGIMAAITPSVNYSYTTTQSHTTSQSHTTTQGHTDGWSKAISQSQTIGENRGVGYEEINKMAMYCEEAIDQYIQRFQKGLNCGMWNVAFYIQANDSQTISELEHTLKGVYSGEESYFEPLRFSSNLSKNREFSIQELPLLYFNDNYNHPIHPSFYGFASALNTEEVSILAALPSDDIEGIGVSKSSSFGLMQAKVPLDSQGSVELGFILNRRKPTSQHFRLSMEALNSHLFVSGITGSGKSNTIKHILTQLQSEKNGKTIPFLLIEPAKSEYKNLISKIPNLQIFRPGAKNDIFKLNPFVFDHTRSDGGVTLTQHVDMLKTIFSSAFPMYGPMAYILEDAIYRIYEDRGWSFLTEDHPSFTESMDADYDRRSLLFPTMEDLQNKIDEVVQEAGYAGEVDSNLKAALKTRIKNLTLGTKGKIFNSRHAFDNKVLFEKPTIVELSNIVSDEEKSFLMALLLNKLYQYRISKGGSPVLKHVTVIEEAHRLLPNISLDRSGEEANSRGKAVETFVNMLAEIRSYGEGLIIADQIVSKLHPDVAKNTNVKIIHRTIDREDREILGDSINLTKEQQLDISELKAGEAIVYSKEVHRAFMVKISCIEGVEEIDNKRIERFYNNFLDSHECYRDELIVGQSLELSEKEKQEISVSAQGMDTADIQAKILDVIVACLRNDRILLAWNEYKNILGKQKNPAAYVYVFIKYFFKIYLIGNIRTYRNIDAYLDVCKKIFRIVKNLNEYDEITDRLRGQIEDLQEALQHKNIKNLFVDSSKIHKNEIDWSLLIADKLIVSNIHQEIEQIMTQSLDNDEKCKRIMMKLFGFFDQNMADQYWIVRYGNQEIRRNNERSWWH